MTILRRVFYVALAACCALGAFRAQWKYWLVTPDRGRYGFSLDIAPLWAPPQQPDYDDFRAVYGKLKHFPQESPELYVERELKIGWMWLDFVLELWLITGVCGGLYRFTHGRKQDFVLHVVWSLAIALTIAAAACFVLWMIFGGWGAPYPEVFGFLGVIVGIVGGLSTYPYSWKATGLQ